MSRASTKRSAYGQLSIASVAAEIQAEEEEAYVAHMRRVGQPDTEEARAMWLTRSVLGMCRICGKAIAVKKSQRFCKEHVQYGEKE
jgi:hypothetical protein